MESLYWTIRGVANGSSRLALRKPIQENLPDFVFIVEPWMDFNKFPQRWLHRFDLKLFYFKKGEYFT